MGAPMDFVAFDRRGRAFAIGADTPDVEQEFRSHHETVRVERMTRDEACRRHWDHLATLPDFAAIGVRAGEYPELAA